MKNRIPTSFAIWVVISLGLLVGCNGSGFMGGVGSQKPALRGNTNANPSPTPPNGQNTGWDPQGDTDQDNPTGTGDAVDASYASLNVTFDGQNAGDDAQFTIFVRRVTPGKQKDMVEAIKTKTHIFASQKVPKFCKCGQTTEAEMYWQHISNSQWARGSLHGRSEGEWIVGTAPTNSWLTEKIKKLPQNATTTYMGADTENPSWPLETTGLGYFRTVNFHPMNPLEGGAHKWEYRDDMRLVFSCEVSECPNGASTLLKFNMHPSMPQ